MNQIRGVRVTKMPAQIQFSVIR